MVRCLVIRYIRCEMYRANPPVGLACIPQQSLQIKHDGAPRKFDICIVHKGLQLGDVSTFAQFKRCLRFILHRIFYTVVQYTSGNCAVWCLTAEVLRD